MPEHPDLLPTVFRCQTCGSEHRIASTRGGEVPVEVCSVCSTPGREFVRAHGSRTERFRRKQAIARAAR